MKFAFEKIEPDFENFIDYPDKNTSGLNRFTPCPITTTLMMHRNHNLSGEREGVKRNMGEKWEQKKWEVYHYQNENDNDTNYIISTAVNHSPIDWCGEDNKGLAKNENFPNRKTPLSLLNKKYLKDLREGKALLLLDQSHEGYQTEWLWSWFHNDCEANNVSPRAIIYVTGNCLADEQYQIWANSLGIKERLKVIPHTHFENMIHVGAVNRLRHQGRPLPTLLDQLEYKRNNLEKLKTFNALQKRTRAHRIWFYKYLRDANLLDKGVCSMNSWDPNFTHMEDRFIPHDESELLNKDLPLLAYNTPNNEKDDGYYITRFNDQTIKDTFVSVVSEASFSDHDNTCFLSEKTFKSIAEFHPFIILGNKNSLHYLKDFGYKTFEGFIDESYDKLSTWARMEAIIKEIKRIDAIEDKMSWFRSLTPILEHNREVLRKNSEDYVPKSMETLIQYYKEYFNV